MSITVRTAAADDIGAILELWQDAAENRSRPVDTVEALETLLRRDPEALLVAEDGAGLVGTVIAGWDGWRCHLYRLAVRADRRREGIGQQLVKAAEARARTAGATRIDAMVLDSNDLGQTIWQTAGYRRQDDWSRWIKPMNEPD